MVDDTVVPDEATDDVAVELDPTRTVGTRVVTLFVLTPTRPLIYSGVFTVSVWTIDARAGFVVVRVDVRVVTPDV